jgi:hypothetical protein
MQVKRILYGVDQQGGYRECRCRIVVEDETDEAIASVPQDVLLAAVFRATGQDWRHVTESAPIPGSDGVLGRRLPFASLERSESRWNPPANTPPPSEMRRRRTVQQIVFADGITLIVMATTWVQLPDMPQDEQQ